MSQPESRIMLIPFGSDNRPDVGLASSNYELIHRRPCLQFRYVSGAVPPDSWDESWWSPLNDGIDNSLVRLRVTKTIGHVQARIVTSDAAAREEQQQQQFY